MSLYVKSDVKLKGNALDKALKERARAKKERMEQRMSTHMAAKKYGVTACDVLAWEYGYDLCGHEEWVDQVGGFPKPKLVFKQCKRCGMVDEKTTEKVNDANMKRVYEVCKKSMQKLSNGLKENKDSSKK